MNKLPIKIILVLIIFIGITAFIINLHYYKNVINNNNIKTLSCTPKQPIDKGIIYAEAMKQFWEHKLNYIWHLYESNMDDYHIGDYDGLLRANDIKKKCGLEKSFFDNRKFTKTTCFPLATINKRILKVYDPKKDGYLYQPEHHNKDTNFVVEWRYGIFKEDCCKLITYKEMQKEINKIEEKVKNNNKLKLRIYDNMKNITDINLLSKIYFLKISHTQSEYQYYPISQCGHLFYHYGYDIRIESFTQ